MEYLGCLLDFDDGGMIFMSSDDQVVITDPNDEDNIGMVLTRDEAIAAAKAILKHFNEDL